MTPTQEMLAAVQWWLYQWQQLDRRAFTPEVARRVERLERIEDYLIARVIRDPVPETED